jgi:hypothetical protein
LARKYNIVTPYTAFLITEDEVHRGVAQRARTLQFENESSLRQAGEAYRVFMDAKDGDPAVAGARSFFTLKAADTPSEAIVAGSAEALRATPLNLPRSSTAGAQPGSIHPAPTNLHLARVAASHFAEQSRFLGGKTFFQNGSAWTDSEVQKVGDSQKIRIQFASPEYFELLQKYPKSAAWLCLGNNLQFVMDGTLFEIYSLD